MAERYDPRYITKVCNRCGGDGEYEIPQAGGSPITVDCNTCRGSGQERVQQRGILKDNVVYTYEILNATDQTDYDNLSDGDEDVYSMILSCSVLDLSTGTRACTLLWAMFGEGTTTRANLIALIA